MKYDKIYGVAIIPAKTDSTRLPKKNLQVIDGKTLLEHTIEYALKSKYIQDIIVSTESSTIRELIRTKYWDNGINIIIYDRPKHLLKDAEVVDVYVDIFQNQFMEHSELKIRRKVTHMIALQPDHPDRSNNVDDMLDYFIDNTYDDLFTVDSKGTRNGSIRITKAHYVMDGTMSRRVGSMLDDCTNVHSEKDLEHAEINILKGKSFVG